MGHNQGGEPSNELNPRARGKSKVRGCSIFHLEKNNHCRRGDCYLL